MKREWRKPVLTMLDVKLTMHNTAGNFYDSHYADGETIPTDPITGQHMDAKS
ncbi:paeninodin family lasso peptide [Neobacillus drentensis]|uniref:paeninodin family lasso peptide n=1 Tax=Neobacillus drentensis TaxID=220684 RepID=UPI003000CE57